MINTRDELESAILAQRALADKSASVSLSGYMDNVVINAVPEPRRFADVRQPWQTDIYRQLDNALESVAGTGPKYTGPRRFWFTEPRGHDKTSSIARRCNWLLGYSRKYLNMATAAADQDQAGLINEMMMSELKLNEWLATKVKVHATRAYGPGGVLKILNSNYGSTWGLNCDLVILDEVTWWDKQDLWNVLISGQAKRNGIFVVISNAGVKGSWQWDVFNTLKGQRDQWSVFETPEYTRYATWMNEEEIARDRKLLPVALGKRVFDNIWIDPGEESGYLVESDVAACEQLGRDLALSYIHQGIHGIQYFAGVDYGPKRDRTALCVLHFDQGGVIRVDELSVWQGSPERPVPIQRVEEWLDNVADRFFRPVLVFDPYQMEGTAQKYEYHQRVVRHEAHGGKSNYQLAANLRSLVVNRKIAWYEGAGDLVTSVGVETFKDELCRLVFVPTAYGYRFDHTARFHDDRAVAVGMAALVAVQEAPSPAWIAPPEMEKTAVDRTMVPLIHNLPRPRGMFDMGVDRDRRRDAVTKSTHILFQ